MSRHFALPLTARSHERERVDSSIIAECRMSGTAAPAGMFAVGRYVPALACLVAVLGLSSIAAAAAENAGGRATVLLVVGVPGEEEFAADFEQQVAAWTKVSAQAGARHVVIGTAPEEGITDYERLKRALEAEPKEGSDELWIVLAGHGTFDGREAKFNLRGPDVSATEMAEWLKPFQRPLAFINTASASAPFLARLSGRDRIVVTSTRSGYEVNYARFGRFLAEALPDPASDIDKDGQVSLLEAFLTAANRTQEFYQTEGRLATEHALIDDNGDGMGTPADWFRGVRAVKKARDDATADGARAHQFHLVRSPAEQQLSAEVRARRDKLELQLAELRDAKPRLSEDAYYRELEKILLAIAELYSDT
jgi:hypothetical protein